MVLDMRQYPSSISSSACACRPCAPRADVQDGTYDGIRDTGLHVAHEQHVFTEGNGDRAGFWNGVAVFVLKQAGAGTGGAATHGTLAQGV